MSTPTPGTSGLPLTSVSWPPSLLALPGDLLLSWAKDKVQLWRRLQQTTSITTTSEEDDPALLGPLTQRVSDSAIAELQTAYSMEQSSPALRAVTVKAPTSVLQTELHAALGMSNGRVRIVSLPLNAAADTAERAPAVVKELAPKFLRGLNALAWNDAPGQDHLLAAGYDKIRNDAGLLVYDTSREPSVSTINTSLSR